MLLPKGKQVLTLAGSLISPKNIDRANAVLNYLAVGRWMKENSFHPGSRLASREKLFERIASEVSGQRVLYLEFGVFQGRATRYWSKLLRGAGDHLHGFDSFEGLPESWNGTDRGEGYFSTNGNLPVIDDPRVEFFKGWFEETLPTYQAPPHDVLVVNMDADLYSSTAYVLCQLRGLIRPGTYIYFDEFNHRDHELRAFDEFMRKTKIKFALAGATTTLERVAFRAL